MWQRCGTERDHVGPGTALEPLQGVGAAVAVEVADQLRVGMAELVGGQLVAEVEVDVDGRSSFWADRILVEALAKG